MVPADDERASTNEPEDNTSTRGTFFERLKFWQRDKKDANEPARLKTLPQYLMHWTTPVWIAAAGFLIALAFAAFWRGDLHWPSADAMKLCATIAGAGFAFSAWQQRSHDNAVRNDDKLDRERAADRARAEREEQRSLEETRRLKQIERDEYWKRREHIFQLLDSKNPGLRLGAVELLAELADQAARSTFLNDIEKQQLQRHIIDTLCLQLRHEGLPLDNEGNTSDRAQIQAAIFETILKRIEVQRNRSLYADWSKEPINITSCIIHAPILIQNLTTDTTIDFSHSKFLSTFELNNATITTLLWEQASFIGELTTRNNSIIGTGSLPLVAPYSRYLDTTFVHNSERFIIPLMNYTNCELQPAIYIVNCKFTTKSTNTSSPIQINTHHDKRADRKNTAQNLYINHCQLADIIIDATYINSRISITNNRITGQIQIILVEFTNEDGLAERIPHPSDRILIRNNVIRPKEDNEPIEIANYTDTEITKLFSLHNNQISRPDDFNTLRTLEYEILTTNPKPFQFLERTPAGQIVHTWQTGGGHKEIITDFGPFLTPFFNRD